MNPLFILGIAGAKGAGKDTIAERCVQKWGFTRIGFADALKDEVRRILRRTLLAVAADVNGVEPLTPDAENRTLDWLIRSKPPIIRALLQEWGTELRRAEDEDYWVHRWVERVDASDADRIVVPDVRFLNEVEAIRQCPLGAGLVVRVLRPGFEGDAHASERSLDSLALDHTFLNGHTIDALHLEVDGWLTGIGPLSGLEPELPLR